MLPLSNSIRMKYNARPISHEQTKIVKLVIEIYLLIADSCKHINIIMIILSGFSTFLITTTVMLRKIEKTTVYAITSIKNSINSALE